MSYRNPIVSALIIGGTSALVITLFIWYMDKKNPAKKYSYAWGPGIGLIVGALTFTAVTAGNASAKKITESSLWKNVN